MGEGARAKAHPECEIVAAWENDPATREELQKAGQVQLTHDSYPRMLAESNCTAIAVGEARDTG